MSDLDIIITDGSGLAAMTVSTLSALQRTGVVRNGVYACRSSKGNADATKLPLRDLSLQHSRRLKELIRERKVVTGDRIRIVPVAFVDSPDQDVSGTALATALELNELITDLAGARIGRVLNLVLVGRGASASQPADLLSPLADANIVVSPEDRVAPNTLSTLVEGQDLAAQAVLAAIQVCGLWQGCTTGAFDDVAREALNEPRVLLTRNYARVVVGPPILETVSNRALEHQPTRYPVPNGRLQARDPEAFVVHTAVDLIARHRKQLSLRSRPRESQPKLKPTIRQALLMVLTFMSRWITSFLERLVRRAYLALVHRIERTAQSLLFGDESIVEVRLGGREHPVPLDPDLVPTPRDIEEIVLAIIADPPVDTVGQEETLDDIALNARSLIDGDEKPNMPLLLEDRRSVATEPARIARDPNRWMDAAGMSGDLSPREQWLSEAAELFRPIFQRLLRLEIPQNVRIVVDVPYLANVDPQSTTMGVCRFPVAIAGEWLVVVVHPQVADAVAALGVLAHELVHASLPPSVGHGDPFVDAVRGLGLAGPPTATETTDDFEAIVEPLLEDLGPPPDGFSPLVERIHLHAAENLTASWRRMTDTAEKVAQARADVEAETSGSRPLRKPRVLSKKLRWLWGLFFGWMGLFFAPILLALLLPVGVLLTTIWLVTAGAAWFGSWVLLGLEEFRAHYRPDVKSEQTRLVDELEHFAGETLRLARLVEKLDTASRVVGLLVHHPIGDPQPVIADMELEAALALPSSFQIQLLRPNTTTIDSKAVPAMQGRVFQRGWLGGIFSAAAESFRKEQEADSALRQSEMAPKPFLTHEGSPRFLTRGDVRAWLRDRFEDGVIVSMADLEPEVFYDFVDKAHRDQDINEFLTALEPDRGEPEFFSGTWRSKALIPDASPRIVMFSSEPRWLDEHVDQIPISWSPLEWGRVYLNIRARSDILGPLEPGLVRAFAYHEQQ